MTRFARFQSTADHFGIDDLLRSVFVSLSLPGQTAPLGSLPAFTARITTSALRSTRAGDWGTIAPEYCQQDRPRDHFLSLCDLLGGADQPPSGWVLTFRHATEQIRVKI
jgi:hypothetical protein